MREQTVVRDKSDIDWVSIDDDEEILWESKPSLITEMDTMIYGVFACLTLILAPLGLFLIGNAYLTVKNREYVMTNKKFYKKTGVFSTVTEESPVANMQNVSYSQSFAGNIFSFGTVEISDASDTVSYKNVKDPESVKKTLTELANTHGSQYGTTIGRSGRVSQPVGQPIRRESVVELRDELQETNSELEELIRKL